MKRALHMIVVLTLTAAIIGSLLAFVFAATWPTIQRNERAELERAVYRVLPGAQRFEEAASGDFSLYRGYDENDALVGIAVRAQGTGFQDVISLMAGFSADCDTVLGLRVLKQLETPGLGAKIDGEEFLNQFQGLALAPKVAVVKGGILDRATGRVEAITGATISSKAVEGIVNNALDAARKAGG
ncbi:FMN-binding protein [Candidatus Fermentibacteria bacterium]|nr:FMN-binding protein [Candidatus Fermentibacteria bacterium]